MHDSQSAGIGCGILVSRHTIGTQCPSSGRSSFRVLWVVSPRSRHRPLLLDLCRLSFPTPHIMQCDPGISNNFYVVLSLCSSLDGNPRCALLQRAGSIYPSGGCCVLCPPLLPHAYPYALPTVYLAVPETLECRVLSVVVTFGLFEQELPFSHAYPRCFFDGAKLRTSTMMQTCSCVRCDLSTSLFLPRVTRVFRGVVADL